MMRRFFLAQLVACLIYFGPCADTLAASQRRLNVRDVRSVSTRRLDSKFVRLAQAPTPKGSIHTGESGGAQFRPSDLGTGASMYYRSSKDSEDFKAAERREALRRQSIEPASPVHPRPAAVSPATTK